MRAFVLLLSLFTLIAATSTRAEVYKSDDPEPTPDETQILEFINRLRADPKADGERIYNEVKAGKGGWMGRGVDMEMFKSEMSAIKAAPPLVMNLKLLDSARKHSFYMIKNGLTHVEEAGKEGFVAADFGARIKAAGYEGGGGGECCFASAPGPYGSHLGFTIDAGPGGTGGMQPGRGHRTNMTNAGFKEVGPSGVASGNRLSVTHNFGNRNVPRLCGGVIYIDKNSNQFYDVDEGVSGVKITSSDGASVTNWKSGGFTLDLKSAAKVTITAEYAGTSFSKTFEAGSENIKFDWIVPEKASLDLADKLLAKVDGIANKTSPAYTSAVVELYMNCSKLGVDAARKTRIDELTKDIGPRLSESQKIVREALANFDAQKFQSILDTNKKPWSSTPAAQWFNDAGTVGASKTAFLNFEKTVESDSQYPISQKKAFAKQLDSQAKELKTSEFSSQIASLATKAEALAKPKPQGGKR